MFVPMHVLSQWCALECGSWLPQTLFLLISARLTPPLTWTGLAQRFLAPRGVHSSALGPGSSQFMDSPSEMPARHLTREASGWNLLEHIFPRQMVGQIESQGVLKLWDRKLKYKLFQCGKCSPSSPNFSTPNRPLASHTSTLQQVYLERL